LSTLAQIRSAVKTTVTTAIPSLFGYDQVADVVHLPAIVVIPDNTDFNVAMGRGTDTHTLNIYVLASRRDSGLAQTELDKYVTGGGSFSIRQAIAAAPSLGLSDSHAHVSGMRGYGGSFSVGDQDHVGAILTLVVHTSGVS
jgi:hypothetical protein